MLPVSWGGGGLGVCGDVLRSEVRADLRVRSMRYPIIEKHQIGQERIEIPLRQGTHLHPLLHLPHHLGLEHLPRIAPQPSGLPLTL